ncbi:cupin-like domain-containing protein [Gilvimarinus algae]|uniref:Cupin-like domain-containing protein n=1 Tax=Gilvimarinus algae TaxID=3058037 RepID=A0ABT8TAZ2_9GAMM|nr:cupin-like domain-containing protein [Gilvimarinus sp. SDUM040014]MDO3381287.1 cupin-like domain-containing protein [Gilvimarinus sp. SDUM040014]
MNTVKSVSASTAGVIPDWVLSSREPVLLRGLVSHWPVVEAGLQSDAQVSAYLERFYQGRPVTYYQCDPSAQGKIFYNDNYSGFNFKRSEANLSQVLRLLEQGRGAAEAPVYYIGSTLVDEWLPGFQEDNRLTLEGVSEPLVSVWLGNQSVVSAHYDCPNNIVCNVAGRRRFSLFPPDQLENLYVGPLDVTPSGRPISLVDIDNPDLEKFPKYQIAEQQKRVVELGAGDALFIPGMWWHHVRALENLNVLVNYWWRSQPDYMSNPEYVLHHALLSLRGLPQEQREIWKNIFNHYIFDYQEDNHRHIPPQVLGVLAPAHRSLAKRIRAHLASIFNRP